MPTEPEDFTPAAIGHQRLNELLERLCERGLTQVQIASKAGLPPQYISDIKHGRRPMTELVARRFGDEFDFNFQWLLGTSDSMDNPSPRAVAAAGSAVWLPLFSSPIAGEPRQHPYWNGAGVELAGAAAGKVGLAKHPYVLQFGHDDVQGRLRRGDLILISQAAHDDAEISVLSRGKSLFLAQGSGRLLVANCKRQAAARRVSDHGALHRNHLVGACLIRNRWSPPDRDGPEGSRVSSRETLCSRVDAAAAVADHKKIRRRNESRLVSKSRPVFQPPGRPARRLLTQVKLSKNGPDTQSRRPARSNGSRKKESPEDSKHSPNGNSNVGIKSPNLRFCGIAAGRAWQAAGPGGASPSRAAERS